MNKQTNEPIKLIKKQMNDQLEKQSHVKQMNKKINK